MRLLSQSIPCFRTTLAWVRGHKAVVVMRLPLMNGSSLIAFRCAVCCAISLALLSVFTTRPNAQQPGPTPSPTPSPHEEQEPIRTIIEEVQLPVAVFDNRGQPDPTLELDDIMVLEDGIPQQIRSARHVPASVLLLLDTGGEINSAKSIRVTRAIAKRLVSALGSRDQISVMQFNNKVELLQDWTTDTKQVLEGLDTKLLSGKRAHFSEAILLAANRLSVRPAGNRHLVMITDGVETPGGRVRRAEALRRLTESNTTVHVISYTVVSLQSSKPSAPSQDVTRARFRMRS